VGISQKVTATAKKEGEKQEKDAVVSSFFRLLHRCGF
jgi:hypothetical protein